jgi:O-antigen/teichoic acid export membrane protein
VPSAMVIGSSVLSRGVKVGTPSAVVSVMARRAARSIRDLCATFCSPSKLALQTEAHDMSRATLFSTFGTTGVTAGVSVVTSTILARNLGPEGRGAVLALTFWPAVLVGVLSLSLNEATTYHMARASGQGGEYAGRYASTGLLLQGLIAVIVTPLAVALILALLPAERRESLDAVLWYTAFLTPLMLLDLHFKAVLQGRGSFRALNLTRIAHPTAYAVALVGLVVSNGLTVKTVMGATLVGLAVSLLIGACLSGVRLAGWSGSAMHDSLATGWKFHLANLLLYAAQESDKFIVLQFMDDTNIGYYAVAIAMSGLGGGIVVQSLAIISSRDMAAATTGAARVGLLTWNIHVGGLLMLLINGAAAAFAPLWLPLLFGAKFEAAVPVVRVLLLMATIKGLRQIIDRAMRAARSTSVGILGESAALVVLVCAAFAGARLAGLEGLAWGLVVSEMCALAVMWALAARALAIKPIELAVLRQAHLAQLDALGREARWAKSVGSDES